MSTPYAVIQPPFTLRFWEMSREELGAYYRWFFEVLPNRIAELTRAVRDSPGFESWQPDRTPDSLNGLGEWFLTQVTSRTRTPEEQREIESGLKRSYRGAEPGVDQPYVFHGDRRGDVCIASVSQ